MVGIPTLLLVEASWWCCLSWSSSFWSLTSSPRAPHLTVARYDAVRLFINIMYLNVSRSLCCFFLLVFSCFKHVHLWQNIQPCRAQVLASPSSWGSATLPRVSTRWAAAAFSTWSSLGIVRGGFVANCFMDDGECLRKYPEWHWIIINALHIFFLFSLSIVDIFNMVMSIYLLFCHRKKVWLFFKKKAVRRDQQLDKSQTGF